MEARRAAQSSLAKERSALGESKRRVRELELEVSHLASLLEATTNNRPERRPTTRDKELGGKRGQSAAGGRGGTNPTTAGLADPDVCRFDDDGGGGDGDTAELAACASDSRETTIEEREGEERGARSVILALEGSLHAAREETEHLKRRVVGLRRVLREAQRRGDRMEAAASSACTIADAERAAAAKATAEAEAATAGKHNVEQAAVAAERRQRGTVDELREKLSRATAVGFEAREGLAAAQKEVSRLRRRVGESDRRAGALEGSLALSTASLHEAEAARVRALVEKVSGGGWEAGEGREDELVVGCGAKGWTTGVGVQPPPAPPAPPPSGGGCSINGTAGAEVRKENTSSPEVYSSDDTGAYETATLRARLAASQAQHMELVRASEEAMHRCETRCEARVRAVVAAGRLASACSRKRGLVAGREAAVEAGVRLAVVRRCFRALREEALIRSRDRSLRRQGRMQRWVGEAFEQAGEEIARTARCRKFRQCGRAGAAAAEERAGGGCAM